MLNLIYSSSMADRGTLSYLNAIKKKIKTNVVDIDTKSRTEIISTFEEIFDSENKKQAIALRPLKDYQEKIIDMYFDINRDLDVEGATKFKNIETTITAEAVTHELSDIAGKKVLIINRSEILGIPLMIELIKKDATVTIAHSKSENLKELIQNCDVLITATGNKDFKIKDKLLENVETIIDLSEDTDINRAIRRIKTVDVLKARTER